MEFILRFIFIFLGSMITVAAIILVTFVLEKLNIYRRKNSSWKGVFIFGIVISIISALASLL